MDAEWDLDGKTMDYDVEFEAGGYAYEYHIDTTIGKILRSQKERA